MSSSISFPPSALCLSGASGCLTCGSERLQSLSELIQLGELLEQDSCADLSSWLAKSWLQLPCTELSRGAVCTSPWHTRGEEGEEELSEDGRHCLETVAPSLLSPVPCVSSLKRLCLCCRRLSILLGGWELALAFLSKGRFSLLYFHPSPGTQDALPLERGGSSGSASPGSQRSLNPFRALRGYGLATARILRSQGAGHTHPNDITMASSTGKSSPSAWAPHPNAGCYGAAHARGLASLCWGHFSSCSALLQPCSSKMPS